MFLLFAALPAVFAAWVLGGRLLSVLEHDWKALWLIWASLGTQIVLFTPIGSDIPDATLRVAHTLTYLPLLVFLWVNRSAGLGLVGAGTLCNFVAISANGGLMPADAVAQQVFFDANESFQHQLNTINSSPRLLFLGDVMALPAWFPYTNAFSIGDVLIAMGLVWVVARCSLPTARRVPIAPIVAVLRSPAVIRVVPAVASVLIGGWIALAASIGVVIGDGHAWLPLLVGAAASVPWAVSAASAAASRWFRTPLALGCSAGAIQAGVVLSGLGSVGGAAVGAFGAGALLRAAWVPQVDAAPKRGEPVRTLLGLACASAGLAAGAVLVAQAGLITALAVAGVLATVGAVLSPSVALIPTDVAIPGRPAVVRFTPMVAVPALVALLTGLGIAMIAAPVWAASALEMGHGAFGLLAGALVAGALCGYLMLAALAPERTAGALGASLVFCALSLGLLASATLAMTAIAGCVTLGISAGAASWTLRPQLVAALRALPTGPLVVAGVAGVLLPSVDALGALWMVAAPIGVMGLVAVVIGLPTRTMVREVAVS